jgi:hypothetical protein
MLLQMIGTSMIKTPSSAALYFAIFQNNHSEYYYSGKRNLAPYKPCASVECKFKLRIFGKYTGPGPQFTSHLDCRTEPPPAGPGLQFYCDGDHGSG